ncbi:hypothetical protein CDD81_8054 [Ophiocordyceps australis]|uniref:Peptidase S9 prolyl oligopeptidase catalytic domain-containing protein n=1 Tax=Ophiocordyceps australis TaxID=1399860 RepID=A0A2C5X8T3_9HYPO|nr:hypothetical protein CDD81_8054 [Ophiocordyceps australis]
MSLFSLRRRQHYHQQQQQQQQQQHQHQHQHHAALASGSRLQRLEEAQEAEDKLTHNPTLALFGAKDGLVPANKVRAWLGRLQAQGAVRLEAQQISGAGHFWAERGVLGELRAGVGRFAEGVLER